MSPRPNADPGRASKLITPGVVETYRQNGWATVPGVLERSTALALQQRICDHVDAGTIPAPKLGLGDPRTMHIAHDEPVDVDELFRTVVLGSGMVDVAKALLETSQIKYCRSVVFQKPPVREGATRPVVFHQDLPYMPLDRTGALTVWVALCDIPPEMSGLHFISGSHRFGPLGRDSVAPDEYDLVAETITRRRATPDAAGAMSAGDATVHSDLMIHGAPTNTSDRSRWALAATYMRTDVRYTGAPWRHTDGIGLHVNDRFDHPRFPDL